MKWNMGYLFGGSVTVILSIISGPWPYILVGMAIMVIAMNYPTKADVFVPLLVCLSAVGYMGLAAPERNEAIFLASLVGIGAVNATWEGYKLGKSSTLKEK